MNAAATQGQKPPLLQIVLDTLVLAETTNYRDRTKTTAYLSE
jgi:hypothetical protein